MADKMAEKTERQKIDAMQLGDLIHYMIANYKDHGPGPDVQEPHWQSNQYLYAYERLNRIYDRISAHMMVSHL